jgi:hypothetical protein
LLSLACLEPAAQAENPLDLVPADVLLCWKGEPYPDAAAASQADQPPSALATLIDAGTRIAGTPLRPRQKFIVRLVEAFGAAVRQPFALTILDAEAKATDDGEGKRVDKLQTALIIKTGGKNEPYLKIVQKAVNELTDQGQATLEKRRAERWSYDELRDKRLSESIAWGAIGDCFIVTYGPDVWPRIAAAAAGQAKSLSHDEWIESVRKDAGTGASAGRGAREGIPAEEGARKDSRTSNSARTSDSAGTTDSHINESSAAQEPLIEVIVAARAIRERLDPFVDGRATRLFAALNSDDVERAYVALGFQGRALYCSAHYHERGRTIRRVYADPGIHDPHILAPIPADARYAIYRIALPQYMPKLFAGYYATRDEKDRLAAQQYWERIQAEAGFDGQKDILDHLGDTIILHNEPQHPLRLPLAFTSLIELRGDTKVFRERVERVLTGWQKYLEESEAGDDAGWTHLERDDDGVWYLQYGPIAGLAWTFTDRYIVTSWSPAALRDYLRKMGNRLAAAP